MAPILPSSFNFSAFVMLLTAILCMVQARCPCDISFCSRLAATILCNNATFRDKCEVVPCIDERCTNIAFRCEQKISVRNRLISASKVLDIRNEIRQNGGCKGNVCFAVDGSSSINPTEYRNQISFVTGVVDLLSPFTTRVAGTQYATRSNPIKPLSTDLNAFRTALNSMAQVGGSTSISSGIEFCFQQLQGAGNELKKVVIIGDSFQNVDQGAIQSADKIRGIAPGFGLVSVVAAGQANDAVLLGIAGAAELVFRANNFADSQKLGSIIRDLSLAICQS